MSKIIGIIGFIAAGKDTAGQVLMDRLGYKKDSFAASLKDTCSSIFGWDREMLEGATDNSRIWRESIDTFWAKELNIPDFTPRFALQYIGTELFRNNFHADTWLLTLKARAMKSDDNIVITDCRFDNEIKMIKDVGGTLIRIQRGPEPEWFDLAKNREYEKLEQMGIHASEYSWAAMASEANILIHNDFTIDEFEIKVYEAAKGL